MSGTPVFPIIPFGVRGHVGRGMKFVPGDPYRTKRDQSAPQVFAQPKGQEEPALPSKATMAANAGKAILRNGMELLKGKQLALSEEEAAKRLAICRKCPFFRSSDERCSKCGCFLSKKTYLRAETCPVGKW